jgi:hypothetical protein
MAQLYRVDRMWRIAPPGAAPSRSMHFSLFAVVAS